jgi:predicted metal-dependent enzyme (double-stranded beta helix superfamily)
MAQRPEPSQQLLCVSTGPDAPAGRRRSSREIRAEHAALARAVARINRLGAGADASPQVRRRVLAAVATVARQMDASRCAGEPAGYGRCVLHYDPAGWSLAAIALRPGQATPPHDHGGWGGAVTIQGMERDRRFTGSAAAGLVPHAERDYPPGTGYLFAADDVHQPVGADPGGVTVALHLLVPGDPAHEQHAHEVAASPTRSAANQPAL